MRDLTKQTQHRSSFFILTTETITVEFKKKNLTRTVQFGKIHNKYCFHCAFLANIRLFRLQ